MEKLKEEARKSVTRGASIGRALPPVRRPRSNPSPSPSASAAHAHARARVVRARARVLAAARQAGEGEGGEDPPDRRATRPHLGAPVRPHISPLARSPPHPPLALTSALARTFALTCRGWRSCACRGRSLDCRCAEAHAVSCMCIWHVHVHVHISADGQTGGWLGRPLSWVMSPVPSYLVIPPVPSYHLCRLGCGEVKPLFRW